MSKNSKQCCQFYPLQGPVGPTGPAGPAGPGSLGLQGMVYGRISELTIPRRSDEWVYFDYTNEVGNLLEISGENINIVGPNGKYLLQVAINAIYKTDTPQIVADIEVSVVGGQDSPVTIISEPITLLMDYNTNLFTRTIYNTYYQFLVDVQNSNNKFRIKLFNASGPPGEQLTFIVDIQSEVYVTYLPE